MAATPDTPAELPAARIPPLSPKQWASGTGAAFEPMRPPEGSAYAARQAERQQGGTAGVPSIFKVFAHHPALTKAFLGFNRHLLYESTLSERVRELAVLRVAYLRGCAYEWAQHVPVALSLDITQSEIDRVAGGPDAPGWSDLDAAVIRAVDDMHDHDVILPLTWHVLATAFNEQQLMDLIFTIGGYDLLAVAFNCFNLELDPELTHYPLPAPQEG